MIAGPRRRDLWLASVCADRRLRPTSRLVGVRLALRSNLDLTAAVFPLLVTLADEAACSRGAAKGATKELRRLGYLRVARKAGRSKHPDLAPNLYSFELPTTDRGVHPYPSLGGRRVQPDPSPTGTTGTGVPYPGVQTGPIEGYACTPRSQKMIPEGDPLAAPPVLNPIPEPGETEPREGEFRRRVPVAGRDARPGPDAPAVAEERLDRPDLDDRTTAILAGLRDAGRATTAEDETAARASAALHPEYGAAVLREAARLWQARQSERGYGQTPLDDLVRNLGRHVDVASNTVSREGARRAAEEERQLDAAIEDALFAGDWQRYEQLKARRPGASLAARPVPRTAGERADDAQTVALEVARLPDVETAELARATLAQLRRRTNGGTP